MTREYNIYYSYCYRECDQSVVQLTYPNSIS